jgi:hypothetical protein
MLKVAPECKIEYFCTQKTRRLSFEKNEFLFLLVLKCCFHAHSRAHSTRVDTHSPCQTWSTLPATLPIVHRGPPSHAFSQNLFALCARGKCCWTRGFIFAGALCAHFFCKHVVVVVAAPLSGLSIQGHKWIMHKCIYIMHSLALYIITVFKKLLYNHAPLSKQIQFHSRDAFVAVAFKTQFITLSIAQVNAPRSCRSGILSLLMNGSWSRGKTVVW